MWVWCKGIPICAGLWHAHPPSPQAPANSSRPTAVSACTTQMAQHHSSLHLAPQCCQHLLQPPFQSLHPPTKLSSFCLCGKFRHPGSHQLLPLLPLFQPLLFCCLLSHLHTLLLQLPQHAADDCWLWRAAGSVAHFSSSCTHTSGAEPAGACKNRQGGKHSSVHNRSPAWQQQYEGCVVLPLPQDNMPA